MTKHWTIIVAGGAGMRMGAEIPKQFLSLAGKPILIHTLEAFHNADPDMGLVVVLPQAHIDMWSDICKTYATPAHTIAVGGASRFDSVASGLAAVPAEAEVIGVQDGVRPFASKALINRCFAQAEQSGSAIPVVAAVDSFRAIRADGSSEIVDRSALRAVQTPQVFRAELLRKAYAECSGGAGFTDDASVVEGAGKKVTLVEGERFNIKITTPEDLHIGEAIKNMSVAF
ncbi:MAG: 2-C-methyl-D-erythritol 4-phosphate cytidylyltransferase [Rikenellaceae bacterium]|nr:2-C-methyl-D-erythritol 4-phosphate cytidylyltransferase [Rikenellaceae bacterium]